MRDAIYLGLRILQLRYKKKDWQIDRKLSSVIDASGAFDRINSQVSDLCKNLEKLKSAEDVEHAVIHLDEFLKEVSNLSENWRKATFIKVLKKRGIVTDLLSQCSITAREVLR
jgi:ABC-type transporter Mla subunit MlaD